MTTHETADLQGYQFHNVYQQLTDSQKEQVIRFWKANNALPEGATGDRRAAQVVMITTKDSEVVGVSSVYVAKVDATGKLYYFYRMFIAKPHRQPMLMQQVRVQTYDILKAWEPKKLSSKPVGVIIMPANKKLVSPELVQEFNRYDWHLAGKNPEGLELFLREF